jgi:hypothetical protein
VIWFGAIRPKKVVRKYSGNPPRGGGAVKRGFAHSNSTYLNYGAIRPKMVSAHVTRGPTLYAYSPLRIKDPSSFIPGRVKN